MSIYNPQSLCITVVFALFLSSLASANDTDANDPYKTQIEPFLETYCFSCHDSRRESGGVVLDIYTNTDHAQKSRKTWEMIQTLVANGEMPPAKRSQPSPEEKELFLQQLDDILLKLDCTTLKHPGRTTLRRLNREEYNNTIQDLTGVKLTPADTFPADDVGYGFDNIGDVLSVQPILLEKYMTAADAILDAAILKPRHVDELLRRFPELSLKVEPKSARQKEPRRQILFETAGSARVEELFLEARGRYEIVIHSYGVAANNEDAKLSLQLDNKELKSYQVRGTSSKPDILKYELDADAGYYSLSIHFANPDKDRRRKLGIVRVEMVGPIGGGTAELADSTELILGKFPEPGKEQAKARDVIARFATRAFRRPAETSEVDRLMMLFDIGHKQGQPFETAIKLPLKAVLVSPNFLFMVEMDPDKETEVRELNSYELATRLSYFLWSSMPDDELFDAAKRGELQTPKGMQTQIARMLRDPKSEALVKNFAGQWLQLRDLDKVSPNREQFRNWNNDLRKSMRQETELFVQDIVSNNKSVLSFLDSNYSFLDQTLARHYGIRGVYGDDFRKVTLTDGRRGGVLTQASVLTVTSNPTRTSPVKRGKWVYENILGLTAPPPPPNIPELPATKELKGTVRQQMDQHRSNPSCASCHAKLDPLGFGLDNFDAVGQWRDRENNQKLDASGVLPDGLKFDGPKELRQILLKKSDLFRKCLAEKLFTYALGRGLEYYDDCAIQEIVTHLKAEDDHFHALIESIVRTDAFRKRKGTRSES